jgi:hypothetical protein
VMGETRPGPRPGAGDAPTDRLPPRLRAVAGRALAVDPRERFASAGEMLDSLRNGAGGTAAPTRPTRPAPARTATLPAPVPGPSRQAGGTAARPVPSPRPVRPHRRRRVLVAAVGALTLVATLAVLLEQASLPTGPAASASRQQVVRPQATASTDTEGSAITTLAASLSGGGLPGDAALARALETTAAQPPGARREATAQQVLDLAQVLVDGGGITWGQYQDVVTVLQPTGATVTTTTTTTVTTTTVTVPAPSLPRPFSPGRGHGHGAGFGGGDQG